MRPASIVNFERVVLLSLAIGVLNTFLNLDEMTASIAAQGFGSGFVIGVQAATIAVILLLVYFISRKGSPVAKWIYVVLSVLGLISGLAGMSQTLEMGTVPVILSVAALILSVISLWLLFRPDSKAWFADGRGGPDTTH
jgi:hypothetical protein